MKRGSNQFSSPVLQNTSCVIHGILIHFFPRDGRLFARTVGLSPDFPCVDIDTCQTIGLVTLPQIGVCRFHDSAFVLITKGADFYAFLVKPSVSSGALSLQTEAYSVVNVCGFQSVDQGKFLVQTSSRSMLLSWTGSPALYKLSLARGTKTVTVQGLELSRPSTQVLATVPILGPHFVYRLPPLLAVGCYPGSERLTKISLKSPSTVRQGPHLQIQPRYCTSAVLIYDRFLIGFGGHSFTDSCLNDIYVFDTVTEASIAISPRRPGTWHAPDEMVAMAAHNDTIFLLGGQVDRGCYYLPISALLDLMPASSLKTSLSSCASAAQRGIGPPASDCDDTASSSQRIASPKTARSSQANAPELHRFKPSPGPISAQTVTTGKAHTSTKANIGIRSPAKRTSQPGDQKRVDPVDISAPHPLTQPADDGEYGEQWDEIVRRNGISVPLQSRRTARGALDFVGLFNQFANELEQKYSDKLRNVETLRESAHKLTLENTLLRGMLYHLRG